MQSDKQLRAATDEATAAVATAPALSFVFVVSSRFSANIFPCVMASGEKKRKP